MWVQTWGKGVQMVSARWSGPLDRSDIDPAEPPPPLTRTVCASGIGDPGFCVGAQATTIASANGTAIRISAP
jgi:hypothetical protein